MPIERFMVPDELEPVSHYCHVVRAGDFIYLSGMVGMKADLRLQLKSALPLKADVQRSTQ